jgi:N-ethylmaleimide reductase
MKSLSLINTFSKRGFTSQVQSIFSSYKMGDLELKNRAVMSALTRQRGMREGAERGVPTELHAEYYSKRGTDSAFIISECTSIADDGDAFPGCSGIYNGKQVEGWKRVIDRVHKSDGKIFMQIWYGGRACHPDNIGGLTPISSSPIAIDGMVWAGGKLQKHVVPKEATKDEIKRLVELFRQGAENAKKAGFDGI